MTTNALSNYLAYYEKCKKPGFAVLVKGVWGAGKTHQVKKILSSRSHYLSLYGLSSTDEIHGALVRMMFPDQSTIKDKISRIQKSFSAGKHPISATGAFFTSYLLEGLKPDIVNTDVIVFDDLERSSIALRKILGIINRYVEHYGCRVVVIAHDEKISQQLSDSKEKIFGQIIDVKPDVDGAFDAFSDELNNHNAKIYINRYKQMIVDIFSMSECGSLRVLRHCLSDIERLYGILDQNHFENAAGIQEITSVFLAFDIEVRMSRIGSDDIPDSRISEPLHCTIVLSIESS